MMETVKRLLGHLAATKSAPHQHLQIVIDADGLWLLQQDIALARQLPPSRLVLTPNVIEFKRLCKAVGLAAEV